MLYRQKKDTCIRNCDGVGYITRSRAFQRPLREMTCHCPAHILG